MNSSLPKKHLKYLCVLSGIALVLFTAYIGLHERRTLKSAERDTSHYGELLAHDLWDIDYESAQEYASVIADEGKFISICVRHDDGSSFVEYRDLSDHGEIRDYFREIGLIRDIKTARPIHYRNQHIGDIITVRENNGIYTYFYLFLLILLSISSIALIRIGRANKAHQLDLEHDLSENRERLQTVVSASPMITFSLDRLGKFTVCEGMGLNKLHENPMNIIGQSIEEVHQDMPTNVGDFLRALKGESFSEIRTTDGRSYETWYSPIWENENIVGVIGVSTDVTAAIHAMNSLDEHKRSQAKELLLAQKSHQAFLPTKAPTLDGFEIGFLAKPSESIGGDYLHFCKSSEKSRLGVTFSEMSGHGVSSALLASIFHTQLEDCMDINTPSIAEAFYEINLRVHDLFPEGRFASTFHTIIDSETNTMRYVKACREPAVLFSSEGLPLAIDKGGPALGLLPSDLLNKKSYIEHSLDLEIGDTLFIYSDGLVEVENKAGVMLERKDIIQWVSEDIHLTPQEIANSIYRKVISHASGRNITDDISIFILRRSKT